VQRRSVTPAEEVEELSDQYAPEGTPNIEVRVFRGRELIERQLCESEAEATEVVEKWAEVEDVTCLVDDLSFHHTPDDVLAPEPAAPTDETYPPG
jgi:hypothetical protein